MKPSILSALRLFVVSSKSPREKCVLYLIETSLIAVFNLSWQDKQPPFRIQNATPSAVEVGIFLPEPDGSGGSEYMGPVATTIVGAKSSRETAMEPPCGRDDESMIRSGIAFTRSFSGDFLAIHHPFFCQQLFCAQSRGDIMPSPAAICPCCPN